MNLLTRTRTHKPLGDQPRLHSLHPLHSLHFPPPHTTQDTGHRTHRTQDSEPYDVCLGDKVPHSVDPVSSCQHATDRVRVRDVSLDDGCARALACASLIQCLRRGGPLYAQVPALHHRQPGHAGLLRAARQPQVASACLELPEHTPGRSDDRSIDRRRQLQQSTPTYTSLHHR